MIWTTKDKSAFENNSVIGLVILLSKNDKYLLLSASKFSRDIL